MNKKKKSPDSKKPTTLSDIVEKFNIPNWDLIMIGDGSGFNWKLGCGWGVVVLDRKTLIRKTLWGGWSLGTVGIAEIMPYLQGLSWYHYEIGNSFVKTAKVLNLHIFSDNETLVKQSKGLIQKKNQSPWWAALDSLSRQGYNITWHWIRRGSIELHSLCDSISKKVRQATQKIVENDSISYDINPF